MPTREAVETVERYCDAHATPTQRSLLTALVLGPDGEAVAAALAAAQAAGRAVWVEELAAVTSLTDRQQYVLEFGQDPGIDDFATPPAAAAAAVREALARGRALTAAEVQRLTPPRDGTLY